MKKLKKLIIKLKKKINHLIDQLPDENDYYHDDDVRKLVNLVEIYSMQSIYRGMK